MIIKSDILSWRSVEDEFRSRSQRSEAAVYSAGTAADTSVCVVRWQHGEHTVAGCVLSFSDFGLCDSEIGPHISYQQQ